MSVIEGTVIPADDDARHPLVGGHFGGEAKVLAPAVERVVTLGQLEDGLGIAILNSNAETHFSFTNALGLVSVEQTHRFERPADCQWQQDAKHQAIQMLMRDRTQRARIHRTEFKRR